MGKIIVTVSDQLGNAAMAEMPDKKENFVCLFVF